MTIDQALTVHEGATVVSPHTQPPFKPLKVSRAWVNDAHTIARFRIRALHDAWVDSTGVELPPKGAQWSKLKARWIKD